MADLLTRLALGALGWARPAPPKGESTVRLDLPPPRRDGGLPLRAALAARHSTRDFTDDALPAAVLGDLLWAAAGINRETEGGRTAPSAMDAQEIQVYAALPQGAYRYEPLAHALFRVAAADVRRLAGYQSFVGEAPLELVYVVDGSRQRLVPARRRADWAHVAVGAMAQDVYLACAALGWGTVLRAWIDAPALGRALALPAGCRVLLCQTVGRPAGPHGRSAVTS